MAAIFKSFLQNLSPLLTSLKVEPLAKPKTSLKFFVNTTKPKTKVVAGFWQKLETKALAKTFREYGPCTLIDGPPIGEVYCFTVHIKYC